MPEVRQNMIQDSVGAPMTKFVSKGGYVFEQISGRGTDDIAEYTLVAFDSAGHLVPLDDTDAVDGTQIPVGVLRGTIPAADIVAGDVSNVELYIEFENFDESKLVLEGDVDLDDKIAVNVIPTVPANITTADATNEATAVTLVNDIKSKLNAARTAGNVAVRTMSLRDYMRLAGMKLKTVEASMGYE